MDLAAIYEKYQVIINLVSGLVLAGAGYLFGKWDSERKRKWELDDREYKRRSEIYDMRIQEAREYVDRLSTYPEILGQFTSILKESITKSEVEREFEVYRDVFLSFLPKMLELSTKGASIEILNDGEIKNLFKELRASSPPSLNQFMDAIGKVSDEYDNLDLGKLKEGIDFDKIEDALQDANKIFTKIKTRLDKLAKTVP